MEDKIKILASIKTDAMEGWGWIKSSVVKENGFYKIHNIINKKHATCYLRIIDDNYIGDYNPRSKTLKIKEEDKVLVLNEYYRKKIGLNKNETYEIDFSKIRWYHLSRLFDFSHPNPYIRQSGRLAFVSLLLAILGIVLAILSLL